MICKEYEYLSFTIEIHEHPIYHDFEYVVKKHSKVIFASDRTYERALDAQLSAELIINQL